MGMAQDGSERLLPDPWLEPIIKGSFGHSQSSGQNSQTAAVAGKQVFVACGAKRMMRVAQQLYLLCNVTGAPPLPAEERGEDEGGEEYSDAALMYLSAVSDRGWDQLIEYIEYIECRRLD